MDLTTANLQALFTGYNASFQQGLESLGADSDQFKLLATDVPSTTAVEVYPWLKSLPRMREWVGDRVVHSLEGADFSIKNRKFELTEGVSRDAIEDDAYGLYAPVFNEMGRSSREHPNELVVEVLEANPKCYDGQPLFDADHPVLDEDGEEISVSNLLEGSHPAWYVMDLSRAIKPVVFQRRRDYDFRSITNLTDSEVFMKDQFLFGVDARVNAGPGLWQLAVKSTKELTPANYEAARQLLLSMRGDYDRPMGLRHTHTVVPSSLEGKARTVIESSNNAAGASNPWYQTSQVVVNPWLKTTADQ